MNRTGLTIAIGLSIGLLLAVGMPMTAFSGPTPGGADTDLDGVEDAFDNCSGVANAGQEDAHHDGCGDACTSGCTPKVCDVDGNGTTNISDFGTLGACFGQPASCAPAADCDGNGTINISDFGLLGAEFGTSCVYGPSGLLAALRTYPCSPLPLP